jgi:hypothetical protein
MRNPKRSVWIIEMRADMKWHPSLDYRESFRSEGQALEKIGQIYERQGKNVPYRAVRYAAQAK